MQLITETEKNGIRPRNLSNIKARTNMNNPINIDVKGFKNPIISENL